MIVRAYCRSCCQEVPTKLDSTGVRCRICDRLLEPQRSFPKPQRNASHESVAGFAAAARRLLDASADCA